ncbi:hypothetical protein ABMZ06_20625 [Pseudomonas aeruginosa]
MSPLGGGGGGAPPPPPGGGDPPPSGRNVARVLLEESGLDFDELVGA